MCKIKILTKNNHKEWDEALRRMTSYDFYHTYSYNTYNSNLDNSSILFCFKYDEFEILIPLVIRKIKNSDYFDITSPYGYVGPLASKKCVPDLVISKYKEALKQFFIENKIVSVFSRLHPSINNDYLLKDIGEIINLSQTVYIDLTQNLDLQRGHYKKDVRYNINKLRRSDFEVIEDLDKNHMNEFIDIYNENMLRVNAEKKYFFDDKYYEMIFNSLDINSKLFFVVKNKIKVVAGIFVFTDNIIQYHLSGTRNDFLKDSPMRLLLDHIRILGTEKGYNELHLGGGLGSTEDSLFNFKSRFSNYRHQFKIWRYIANPDKYKQLVNDNNITKDTGFFPLYRSE